METWKHIPSTPFLPFLLLSGSLRCVLELQASGLSHLWHQGPSAALHLQISCILCRRGAGGGLCYWGMHVKRHWRLLNSRVLIHCHIMDHLGQKEPEKMMHVLKFTTFPKSVWNRSRPADNAHFLLTNVFLIFPSCRNVRLSIFLDLVCPVTEERAPVKHPHGSRASWLAVGHIQLIAEARLQI